MLASGIALAAAGLTLLIASHLQQSPEEYLGALDTSARKVSRDRKGSPVTAVVAGMLRDQGEPGVTLLGQAIARDEAEFLDLLVDLAEYCGTSIMVLEYRCGTPKEETLQHLEDMLQASA